MKYVSIDIETTGLHPEKHQMIEFGAVIEDTENPLPIKELPRLRILVVHDNYVSNPYCIKLHSKLFEELGKYTKVSLAQRIDCSTWVIRGARPIDLGRRFRLWLINNGIDVEKKVIVAGKNFNGFDAKFLKRYIRTTKIHHRVLDPMPLFVRPTDTEPPNLSECAKRAGIDFKGTGYHTAVSDAIMVVELLRAGRKNNGINN
jgi:oligoribonuclease